MWRAFLLVALVFQSSLFGQDYSGWIGKRVITRYGTVLRIGNTVVGDENRQKLTSASGKDSAEFFVYRIDQVNGPWLWLTEETRGTQGWVKIENVIPYDQAIDYFTNEIRASPGNATNYVNRGLIWAERKELDIAIADFSEAIRLDPKSEGAYINRGSAFDDKKEYDKAIADYTEALRISPRDVVAYVNRGTAWHKKNNEDMAIADFSEAIRLEPTDEVAFNNRGNAWLAKKEYDKAVADYDQAIRLTPKWAYPYNNRGNAWRKKREYEKAITDYSEAIRLDPKWSYPYGNRGYVWLVVKEYDKSLADSNEAIRLNPKSSSPYRHRAWLWATCPDANRRDGKKAIDSATRACELSEWKDAENIDALAASYAETAEFAKAVEWQEKANKLYSNPEDWKSGEKRLRLYTDKKPYRDND